MSIFNEVPLTKISRSLHNESHQTKLSFDAGPIYPVMTELAYPGDKWRVGLESFIRTMPMIAPVMDRIDVKVDAFFIPLRLIWDDFEDFITLGITGEFTAQPPTITIDSTPSSSSVAMLNRIAGIGGLADYLNFSTNTVPTSGVAFRRVYDALPFRAYQLLWNEYFRNENLDAEVPIAKSSGNEILQGTTSTSSSYYYHYLLRNRGWRKDYFTSALPFPQKGPAVKIPYGDVVIEGSDSEGSGIPFKLNSGGRHDMDELHPNVALLHDSFEPPYSHPDKGALAYVDDDGVFRNLYYESGLRGKLDSDTLPTIEELRYAECLQEFYEANARGGTRPKEYYLNIWHTRSKDSRLDRPEYLGGYRGSISITDIDQTSQSDVSAQGTLAGKGVSAGGNKLFNYRVPEWGIIMVTMSVVPKSAYFQGDRRWNMYQDVFDWPNPFFANLGEQELKKGELYYSGTSADSETWGYTPRYAEGKFIPDQVHGQFRSSLDYWHLARKFNSLPNLNAAFAHIDPSEVARIFPSQVNNNDKFVGTLFFHIKRSMYLPYFGVPRLIHSI